jgi:hypothetical protein
MPKGTQGQRSEKRRFPFPGSIQAFLILSGLEALLIFAPEEGFPVPFWPVASAGGLMLLAALAWFSIPETISAKRS